LTELGKLPITITGNSVMIFLSSILSVFGEELFPFLETPLLSSLNKFVEFLPQNKSLEFIPQARHFLS
jgi:hypothetical protein